jgi:hypothetical protein
MPQRKPAKPVAKRQQPKTSTKFKISKKDLGKRKSKDSFSESEVEEDLNDEELDFEDDFDPEESFSENEFAEENSADEISEDPSEQLLVKRQRRTTENLKSLIKEQELNFQHNRTKKVN